MKMVKYRDIEHAFFFVSSAGFGLHTAVLDKGTGQLYYRSEMGDLNEIDDKQLDWARCIEIPHKNDLELGQELVFEFVEAYIKDESDRVRQFFRKRGAYSRFKHLLGSKGLLQRWYEFENQRVEAELRDWCEVHEIELSSPLGSSG